MRIFLISSCLLSLVACGSKPEQCHRPSSGTYLVQFKEKSGNCGEIPDLVTQLTDDPGCTYALNSFSEDGCRNDVDVTCRDGQEITRLVGYLEQQDEYGSELEGVATFYMSSPSFSCTSTYELKYERL